MAEAASEFESLRARIGEMDKELQSLRKLLFERMPQLTVGCLEVTGGMTVQETLAAATLREGGQSLGEKYQVKGDYQPRGQYQPAGSYLTTSGGAISGELTLKRGHLSVDCSAFTGSAGRDILRLKANQAEDMVVITIDSHDALTIWDSRPNVDKLGFIHVVGVREDSDARLKRNITSLENVLGRLTEVRGVSFEWNEVYDPTGATSDQRQIGVIAQEVEAAFPELAWNDSDRGFKTLNYGRLVPILIEALKDLRQEKDRQLAALGSKVEALERRLQQEQPFALRKEVGYDTASA